ncbi:hypothetical protein L0222_17410 [bacterium]|nr:hypothetical protein [bacterium]MCI0603976.1 hypothetical protein [bacterium]
MKKRLLTVVLFAISLTSGFAFGEGGWSPGDPKPIEGWFTQIGLVCSDLWNYLF